MNRKLSEPEKLFIEELTIYDQVLALTLMMSDQQKAIDAGGRGVRGVQIFTRQTLTAVSLGTIFPRPSGKKERDAVLWDICSLASLSRNLMEGYISLYYFGLENISESEADLRFKVFQVHRNIEWYNIRKSSLEPDELKQFEDGIPVQKNEIKNHPFLSNLPDHQRKQVLAFREMYKTKPDFERELTVCKGLVEHYRFLSNLVHPLPLSIFRTDNEHGRGIGSERDIMICLNCLMLGRKYLAASTIGIADHFQNRFVPLFKKEIEKVREFVLAGF